MAPEKPEKLLCVCVYVSSDLCILFVHIQIVIIRCNVKMGDPFFFVFFIFYLRQTKSFNLLIKKNPLYYGIL